MRLQRGGSAIELRERGGRGGQTTVSRGAEGRERGGGEGAGGRHEGQNHGEEESTLHG